MSISSAVTMPQTPKEFFKQQDPKRSAFLQQQGYTDWEAIVIAEDWAARRYWRLTSDDQSRILMESAPDDHPLATPGHKISDMVKISEFLGSAGVHVPALEAVDDGAGYVLMEDLGDQTLPLDREAYMQAADVLKTMQAAYSENHLDLPDYKGGAVDVNKRRLMKWYLPLSRGSEVTESEITAFDQVWNDIEAGLPAAQNTLVHIDFHADNVLWLAHEIGLKRCGILDFQGAHFGSNSYDLVNLLEDIRRDVPEDIKRDVRGRFCDGMSAEEKESFNAHYNALHCAFYCRIVGQLIRMYSLKQDQKHLDVLPHVAQRLSGLLDQETFKLLQAFLNESGLNLSCAPTVTPKTVQSLVHPDF